MFRKIFAIALILATAFSMVVGELVNAGAAREQTALGETPNLAARLQALAEPDAVVIAMGPWSIMAAEWLPLPPVFGLKGHSILFETGSKVIDKGRFEFTHDESDMYVFKVSSLRNVAMTPPYFHDGSVATLSEAVRIMAKVQRNKILDAQDNGDIVAFLGSLTGKLPDNFVREPLLPTAAFTAGR
jgi:hypothetical protein